MIIRYISVSVCVYICIVAVATCVLPSTLTTNPHPHPPTLKQVKFNPGRSDNMIIQSIALLDQLDKDLNTFAMRVREWYCWHFPELRELVKDNYVFARCAAYIQDRTTLTEEKVGWFVFEDIHTYIFIQTTAALDA